MEHPIEMDDLGGFPIIFGNIHVQKQRPIPEDMNIPLKKRPGKSGSPRDMPLFLMLFQNI